MLKRFCARLKILRCRGLMSFKSWKCSFSVNTICNRTHWKLKSSNADMGLSGVNPAEDRHWNQAHDTYWFLVLSALRFCWEYIVSNFHVVLLLGVRYVLRGHSGRSVLLTTHCLLVPRWKKEYSHTSIPPSVPSWHVKVWSFVLVLFRISV